VGLGTGNHLDAEMADTGSVISLRDRTILIGLRNKGDNHARFQ